VAGVGVGAVEADDAGVAQLGQGLQDAYLAADQRAVPRVGVEELQRDHALGSNGLPYLTEGPDAQAAGEAVTRDRLGAHFQHRLGLKARRHARRRDTQRRPRRDAVGFLSGPGDYPRIVCSPPQATSPDENSAAPKAGWLL